MEWVKGLFSSQHSAGKDGQRSSSLAILDRDDANHSPVNGHAENDEVLRESPDHETFEDVEENLNGVGGTVKDAESLPKDNISKTPIARRSKRGRQSAKDAVPGNALGNGDKRRTPSAEATGTLKGYTLDREENSLPKKLSRTSKVQEVGGRAARKRTSAAFQETPGSAHDEAAPELEGYRDTEESPEAGATTTKARAVKSRKSRRKMKQQEDNEEDPQAEEGLFVASEESADLEDHSARQSRAKSRKGRKAEARESSDHEEEDSIQPSANALGKRIAVDDPVSELPSKRRRMRSGKEILHSADIRDMWNTAAERISSTRNCDPNALHNQSTLSSMAETSRNLVIGGTSSFTPINQNGYAYMDSELNFHDQPLSSMRRKRRLHTGDEELEPRKPTKSSIKFSTKSSSMTPKTPNSGVKTPRVRSTPASAGPLTKHDIERIADAVEAYRSLYDLSQYEMNDLIQRDAGTDGREFWILIYDELPDLSRRNVQSMCRRRFHNFKQGPFTEEDDEELRRAYERNSDKWKLIGAEINRFPEAARDRWRNYVLCGKKLKKDIWSKEEETTLKRVAREYLVKAREALLDAGDTSVAHASDETLIDWGEISKQMNHTRNRLQCANKWKNLKERAKSDVDNFTKPAPVSISWRLKIARDDVREMTAGDKLRLLHAIRETNAGSESTIPWKMISMQELNTKGIRMAWRLCLRKLKERVQGHEAMTLQEVVTYLIDLFEAAAPEEPADLELDMATSPSATPSEDEGRGSTKKKRKRSKKKLFLEQASVDAGFSNGEGPSTQLSTKSRKSTSRNKAALDSVERPTSQPKKRKSKNQETLSQAVDRGGQTQAAAHQTPSSTLGKRKFRDQMLVESESQIDAVVEQVADAEGLSNTKKKRKLRSTLKSTNHVVEALDRGEHAESLENFTARPRSRARQRAKQPIYLSEERVVEDESDEGQEQELTYGVTLANEEENLEANPEDAGDGTADDGEVIVDEIEEAPEKHEVVLNNVTNLVHQAQMPAALDGSDDDAAELENPVPDDDNKPDLEGLDYEHGRISPGDENHQGPLQEDSESIKDYEDHGPTNAYDDDSEEQGSKEDYPGDSQADEAIRNSKNDSRVESELEYGEDEEDKDDEDDQSIKSEPSDNEDRTITLNGFHDSAEKEGEEQGEGEGEGEEDGGGFDDEDSNEFHDRESVDLDEAVMESGHSSSIMQEESEIRSRDKILAQEEFRHDMASEFVVSSDDGSEDIPARIVRRPRMESVDLDG